MKDDDKVPRTLLHSSATAGADSIRQYYFFTCPARWQGKQHLTMGASTYLKKLLIYHYNTGNYPDDVAHCSIIYWSRHAR
jgi:hypothetical protein